MQVYLVGGAVRDKLLGLPARERDWVVVGATPDVLEQQGYQRVGREFPVFLHPETREEYALARTERKTGPGYRGFVVHAEPDVTLEQDLERRDLTINAIARGDDGTLVDPYGGQQDLADRLLRHVSDAFREDPVRILRVARFAARFHNLGFRVAPDTAALMCVMVEAGECDALVPERVWRETESALRETRPDIFFRVLRDCGALKVIYPELDALFGVPQTPRWHPEIDTGEHVMLALRQATQLSDSTAVRFAATMHDLGKGKTPQSEWPRHIGHETRGVELVGALCDRLAVPNRCRELAIHVTRWHGLCHRAAELRPRTVLELLESVDAFRRPERFAEFLLACEADARGRTGLENRDYPQSGILQRALAAAAGIDTAPLRDRGLAGPEFGAAIREARIAAIASARD